MREPLDENENKKMEFTMKKKHKEKKKVVGKKKNLIREEKI
jgi:hypothetical protein